MATEPLTESEVDAMLARAEAAPPGPWQIGGKRGLMVARVGGTTIKTLFDFPDYRPVVDFILHSRSDLPRLARDWRRLHEENVRLRLDNAAYAAASAQMAVVCHEAAERVGLTENAWGRQVPDVLAEECERLRGIETEARHWLAEEPDPTGWILLLPKHLEPMRRAMEAPDA